MKSRAFSLVEIVIALAVLSALGSVAYVQVANTRQAADAAKLVSDVEAINRAIPLYATFGGSFSQDDDVDTVLRKLKTRRNSTNANTSPGLVENFLDPRVMPEWQSGHEAGSSRERAVLVWDTPRHMPRFEIVSSGTTGIKKFVFDETQTVAFASAPDGDAAHRESRSDFLLASDRTSKTGKWVWEYGPGGAGERETVVTPEPEAPPPSSDSSDPEYAPPPPTPIPVTPDEAEDDDEGGGGGGGGSNPGLPIGALVGNIGTFDGVFDGSIMLQSTSNLSIVNGNPKITGNLYVAGMPTIMTSDSVRPPPYAQTDQIDAQYSTIIGGVDPTRKFTEKWRVVDDTGSASPSNYTIRLNNSKMVVGGKIVRRSTIPAMPEVVAPTESGPNISVSSNTVNKAAGSYGAVEVTNSGVLTLTGSTDPNNPAVFSFQSLKVTNGATLNVAPGTYVSLSVGEYVGTIMGGIIGNSGSPGSLILKIAKGNIRVNSSSNAIHAQLVAPNSIVELNGVFTGGLVAKTLNTNSSGIVFSLSPKIN